MKVPHGEGLATHTGPKSCTGVGNCVSEALTGVRAGRVLSRENRTPRKREVRGADAVRLAGRQHPLCREREAERDPARSETPGMYGRTSRGSRETPRLSARSSADRSGNPPRGTPLTYGRGESDSSILPRKPPNKAVGPAAEVVEGRGLAEGKPA